MRTPGISHCDRVLRLILSNGKAYERTVDELKILYGIISGSEVLSNDAVSFLLLFDSEAWLVPKYTNGLRSVSTGALARSLIDKSCLVSVDYLPRRWRRGFGPFKGVEPKFGVYDAADADFIEPNAHAHHALNALDYV